MSFAPYQGYRFEKYRTSYLELQGWNNWTFAFNYLSPDSFWHTLDYWETRINNVCMNNVYLSDQRLTLGYIAAPWLIMAIIL